MRKRRAGHVLATVLFTDIVDSSRIAHELGDARWRVLLARHHSVVREALKRYHGREVDNAGDGFFATFGDQVDAVRCACSISDEVRSLGIEVRAGCHVGQAEVLGRKLGGVTVHAGARVMAEAAPGEVLVSGVLKDLVPASGFEFADRGTHELKGIEGEWRLFAVTSVDGTPRPPPLETEEAKRRREEIKPPPLAERRSGRLAIAALALLIAIGAVLVALSRPQRVQVRPNSLVRIDPKTDEIVADVPLAIHPGTSQLTFVPPNKIWAMSELDQVISVVDTDTNTRVRLLGGFGGQTSTSVNVAGEGIAYAFGRVWASGPTKKVDRLDPISGAPGRSLRIPGAPDLLAVGFGRVWVASHDIQRVFAIDPNEGRVTLAASIGEDMSGIAVGEGAVWVSSYPDSMVSKIDPRSGTTTPIDIVFKRTVAGTRETVRAGPSGIGIGFSSVWVADTPNGYVHRIDPATDRIIASIPIGQAKGPPFIALSSIIAADGSLWVTSPASKTIVQIDPATNTVASRIHVPYTPRTLLFAAGSVWATVEAA